MNQETNLDDLSRRARDVVRAPSAAEVFKALLEASRTAAPRAAVYLVRRTEIHGWGSFGYASEVARAQRVHRVGRDEGWLGAALQRPYGDPLPRGEDHTAPDFGQPPADDAVACSLRIDGRPIAVIVGERASGESPWSPEALALLAAVGELRLELDLARRRAAGSQRKAAAATATGSSAEAETESGTEAVAEKAPDLGPARRYAKLVATDIRLYNEEAVMLGRRNGDLSDRLGDHLGRGRETFMRRHGDLGPTGLELLHEAYVQVLAAGDASLIPASLLDR